MPKSDKLLEQVRSNPVDMSYADLRKLLTALGWRIRESGSHVHRHKPLRFQHHVGPDTKQGQSDISEEDTQGDRTERERIMVPRAPRLVENNPREEA